MSAPDLKNLKKVSAAAKANAPAEMSSIATKIVVMALPATALLIGLVSIIKVCVL